MALSGYAEVDYERRVNAAERLRPRWTRATTALEQSTPGGLLDNPDG